MRKIRISAVVAGGHPLGFDTRLESREATLSCIVERSDTAVTVAERLVKLMLSKADKYSKFPIPERILHEVIESAITAWNDNASCDGKQNIAESLSQVSMDLHRIHVFVTWTWPTDMGYYNGIDSMRTEYEF